MNKNIQKIKKLFYTAKQKYFILKYSVQQKYFILKYFFDSVS